MSLTRRDCAVMAANLSSITSAIKAEAETGSAFQIDGAIWVRVRHATLNRLMTIGDQCAVALAEAAGGSPAIDEEQP